MRGARNSGQLAHHQNGDQPGIARGAPGGTSKGGLGEGWRRTGRERCETERPTPLIQLIGA